MNSQIIVTFFSNGVHHCVCVFYHLLQKWTPSVGRKRVQKHFLWKIFTVRYTFLATSVFPPLGIQKVQSQSLNNYIQEKFVNTGKQQSSKKVNSGLLLLFLLKYKQFTDKK